MILFPIRIGFPLGQSESPGAHFMASTIFIKIYDLGNSIYGLFYVKKANFTAFCPAVGTCAELVSVSLDINH